MNKQGQIHMTLPLAASSGAWQPKTLIKKKSIILSFTQFHHKYKHLVTVKKFKQKTY